MNVFTVANLRVAIDEETGVGGMLLPDPALDARDYDPDTSLTRTLDLRA